MNSQNLRPELEQSLEHRSLSGMEGLWKVVHHGNLKTAVLPEKTPRLVIYFRKLVNQHNPITPADFETQGMAVAKEVPAAELMRLPLNVLIENSRIARDPCLPLPSEEMGILDVDFSKSKFKLISRHAKFHKTNEYVIPYMDGRSPLYDSVGGRAYYVAIEYKGDPFGIIIPCAEVFRFFYCTSSRMLYTILSDKILNPDRFIIDPARSGTQEDNPKIAAIWLRQWMLNSDRRHIARLFFTPDAFEEAKTIFLRASGNVGDGAFKHALIASPPNHGEMNLKCIFKRLISKGQERFFVTRLISATNWTIPFDEIHFGRDNDARTIASDKERAELPEDERTQRPNVLVEGAEISILENVPGDNSIVPVEINDTEFESRFPELDKIYSPQIEKINQFTKNAKGKKQLLLADGSLIEGSSAEHEGLVNVILRAMEKAAEIKRIERERDGAQSEPLKELDVRQSKLHDTIEYLELARVDDYYANRLQIDYLPVLDELGLIKGKLVNLLPESIDDKNPVFLYLDADKCVHRPVLIASLNLDGESRYLIDFMQRYGQSNTSSLVLWHPDGKLISDSILDYAINLCVKHGGVKLTDGQLLMSFFGSTFKHTFAEKTAKTKPRQLIEKIFSRENKMNWLCGVEVKD
ncbi:hypothetical protein [Sulfurirhabdus autotrophica]|uniref:Uncharacterized protein n=1 Tax=Sulfurirhabdus autotrophica TaxID=1706046 RepID=A0A4V2W2J1_9PROT|nr:hypothetical protein [Sulfurirhabdus autotrophica]TCV88209.1 hypothetical protein EDC63_104166 [Sulfurirhabdus autotrophica]